jgi:hypothetical protein
MKYLAIRSVQHALVALCLTVTSLHAHFVWIEDTLNKQLVIRFGEPAEDYEESPGYLDRLSLPVAWKVGNDDGKRANFVVEKKSDHFLLVAADPGQPALGETGFPVMKRGKSPATKPFFYVRWFPHGEPSADLTPALTLDLTPTAETGVFRLLLRGEPLADTKIVVHAPNQKETELKTDAHGLVRFTATKPGLHLLTANYREPIGGFAAGVAFERTSHNTAVAWRQP